MKNYIYTLMILVGLIICCSECVSGQTPNFNTNPDGSIFYWTQEISDGKLETIQSRFKEWILGMNKKEYTFIEMESEEGEDIYVARINTDFPPAEEKRGKRLLYYTLSIAFADYEYLYNIEEIAIELDFWGEDVYIITPEGVIIDNDQAYQDILMWREELNDPALSDGSGKALKREKKILKNIENAFSFIEANNRTLRLVDVEIIKIMNTIDMALKGETGRSSDDIPISY